MRKRRLQKSFAVLAAVGLIVAACGGDDDDAGDDTEQTDTGDDTDTGDTDTGDDTDTGGDTDESGDDTDESGDDADVEAGDVAEGDVDTEIEEVAQEASYGGEAVVGLEAEINGMRGWEDNCAFSCYNVLGAIYDKLFERTADGGLAGVLAIDITPSDDFTVWVMNLREGVSFHNGVAFNAQTVADMFPLQQVGATASGQVAAAGLAAVEATGEFEVTYTLAAPNVAFPSFIERTTLGMVFEPALAAADLDGYNNNPIGTGPFVFESRDIDNETRVVRNENYWRKDAAGNQLPYLDSISFRPIPDEGARLDSLLSGTINIMTTARQGTIRDARADSDGLTLVEAQGNSVGGGHFNLFKAPYDDVRVRRGLTHMNSQENVIEALGGTGISLPGTQQFSPDSPWFSEKVAAAFPKFDFPAGVALLTEYVNDPERSDGKAVGEKIDVELSCPPDPTLIAAMQVIKEVWDQSELVNTELTQFDQSTHISTAFAEEHEAHCWRMGSDADPALWLTTAVAPPSEAIATEFGYGPETVSSLNYPNWFDQEAYEAALAAQATDDFDTRYALYESIFLKMAEDVPFWYSGHTAYLAATADNVFGVNGWTTPDGVLGSGISPEVEVRWHEVFIES